jgi:hypothetical protein
MNQRPSAETSSSKIRNITTVRYLTLASDGQLKKITAMHAIHFLYNTTDIFLKFLLIKALAKEAAEINDNPYSTTFSYYWQKRIFTTLQRRYNANILQQAQYSNC